MAPRLPAGTTDRPPPALLAPATITALIAGLALLVALEVGGRQALLLVTAIGLGIALYRGALSFTAHWRRLLANGDTVGVKIQLWIIGLGSLAFFPLIGGWMPGFDSAGAVAPLALELVIGAFLFGIGMQLANGCGSGTLFTLGGGSTKMVLTLAAFIAGSLIATFHLHLWRELPRLPAVSLVQAFGVTGGLAMQALLLGALLLLILHLDRNRTPGGVPSPPGLMQRWLHLKPVAAATCLTALAVLVFWLSGQPWSVTFAFALWGGQVYEALGGSLAQVPFWSVPWARAALDQSVLHNATSVTNLGVMAGALLAAVHAGRFRPRLAIPWRHSLAALIGGLLMGYGARLAHGCNIGALLGGTMSGSLHGWLWLAAAVPGMWLGIRLRPRFGLEVEGAGTRAECNREPS